MGRHELTRIDTNDTRCKRFGSFLCLGVFALSSSYLFVPIFLPENPPRPRNRSAYLVPVTRRSSQTWFISAPSVVARPARSSCSESVLICVHPSSQPIPFSSFSAKHNCERPV